MAWRTQARAIGVIASIWAAAAGVVGAGIVIRPLALYPSLIRAESILDGLRYVGAWTGIGAVCGTAFSLFILAFARRQSVGRITAIPVTVSVATLAFLVGVLTDGSKAGTGLAVVASVLAIASLWISSRPTSVGQGPAERAT